MTSSLLPAWRCRLRLIWLLAAFGGAIAGPCRAETVLRIVLSGAPTGIDPVQTTAAYARDHGFLVYDQLFALDSAGVARPQMVEQASRSENGRLWRFTLRPGLMFHDGEPVRAADAVASIRRWGARDPAGRALMEATARLEATGPDAFELELARPFAFVTETLARPSASALFVMPERVAVTPPTVPITDATGSGPFIFVSAESEPGHRAIYRRNPAYLPRDEPADGLAGGKRALVDRVEWLAMPDAATAAAALRAGEIDYVEQVAPDLQPLVAAAPGTRLFAINPDGFDIWLRINHQQPPFDDPRARQALRLLVDPAEVLGAAGIAPAQQPTAGDSWFAWPAGEPHVPHQTKARALLRDAGAEGAPVVFMDSADQPVVHAASLVLAQAFAAAGLRVDVQTLDWGTVTHRRSSRKPLADGGWSLFVTLGNVRFTGDPLTNLFLASPCTGGIAGWPCDRELERLRQAWWEEEEPARRAVLLGAVHDRAATVLPYVEAGRFVTLAGVRDAVSGLRATTVPVFWGLEKR